MVHDLQWDYIYIYPCFIFMYMHYKRCHRARTRLQLNIYYYVKYVSVVEMAGLVHRNFKWGSIFGLAYLKFLKMWSVNIWLNMWHGRGRLWKDKRLFLRLGCKEFLNHLVWLSAKHKSILVDTMKTCRGRRDIVVPLILISSLAGGEWSTSSPSRFTPRKGPPYPLNRGWLVPQIRSERFGQVINIFSLLEFETRTVQPFDCSLYWLLTASSNFSYAKHIFCCTILWK